MRTALLCLFLCGLALPAAAQSVQQPTSTPPLLKYGKWGLLAASVTMNLLAARAHDQADHEYTKLQRICSVNSSVCTTGPDGTYSDPTLESIYQQTLRYDRRSRNWIIAGETALVGSAVLFIWEFSRPKGPPANIPFEPKVSNSRYGTQVGLIWSF